MPNKLKSLWRRSLHKNDDHLAEQQSGQALDSEYQSASQGHGPSTSHGERRSNAFPVQALQSTASSSELSSELDNSRRHSRKGATHPDRFNGGPVTVAHGQSTPEDDDRSVADNYKAYLSVLSPGDTSADSQHMTLGGDRRLATVPSERKFGEDIADRNIDQYGTSPPQGYLAGQQDDQGTRTKFEPSNLSPRPQRGFVGNFPVGSIVSPDPASMASNGVPVKDRATGGSLVDGDLTHAQTGQPRPQGPRAPGQRRQPRETKDVDVRRDGRGSIQDSVAQHENGGQTRFIADGEGGRIDLRDTKDVDKATHWAPAVTHEVVKPTEHEIIEERVYREIHNHDVYHYIQPVYELEILPARHFVHDPKGALVEVSEDQILQYTGGERKWYIAEKEQPPTQASAEFLTFTEPRIIKDETYITPEGFERRETTILHPPELEDMSNYIGPVMPIHFMHRNGESAKAKQEKLEMEYNHRRDSQPLSLKELTNALPAIPTQSQDIARSPSTRFL